MESLLCPVLIERRDELDALTDALDEAAHGRGQTIFVTGDAGVGKSRLVREAAGLATARGFHVLTGRGTESAVPVPYRPVTEALMGAARSGVTLDIPGLADYRAALGSLVPEWRQPEVRTGQISAMILGEAVLRLLTRPDWHGGSLLVLEDLHWADPETLAFVEYLSDNIADTSVLCLITLRSIEGSSASGLLRSATSRRAATTVDVPRLSRDAIERMAAACLSADSVPHDVVELLADCDGLPFAVEEILSASASSGELIHEDSGWRVNPAVSTGVPDSIASSVRNRLSALGTAIAGVIVSAAILGRQFDWPLLPRVSPVSESDVLAALKRGREVGLIEPVGTGSQSFKFRHSLTRDAIIADLLPPDVATKSAAAAAAIEHAHPGLPGTWCQLAAELRVAAGQRVAAARLLLTAGSRDLAQGSLSSTIETLRDARKLLNSTSADEPGLVVEIDEQLAEALAMAGDLEALDTVTDELIAWLGTSEEDLRRQALADVRVAMTRPADNPEIAASHLRAADVIARKLDDDRLTMQVEATAARLALATGEIEQAEELAREALASAEQTGLAEATDVALISLEVLGRRERLRDLDAGEKIFRRAVEIAEQHEGGAWGIRARHELATIDMLRDGSTSSLAEVRELAHRAGVTPTTATIELQLANLWSLGTDLDKALATARQCERTSSEVKLTRFAAKAISIEANIAGIRGDRKETERLARRAEALLPGDADTLAATHGFARVLAALFGDDLPRAMRESTVAMSWARQRQTDAMRLRGYYSSLQSPISAPGRAVALHALLEAATGGDVGTVIERARHIGANKGWNLGCLAYAEAVAAGRAGATARATEIAEQGNAYFAPFAPWWNHLARRLVSEHALQDGWGDPVGWMRDAAHEFDATSHARLASACRGILRRAGERVPRAGRGNSQVPPDMRRLGITSREMDVFALVARGMSNSQIATELYISPKTVETHVASLIAKTSQSSRRELVAHAAGQRPSGGGGGSAPRAGTSKPEAAGLTPRPRQPR
jgi:DNA-binding CsgD family transcriptional regulator/tetratricopeptide (TPR) repeat protein